MLAGAGGDKEVVQKYTSAATVYAPLGGDTTPVKPTEETKEELPLFAIIGVIVVIAACVGIGIGMYLHMKKKKGSSGGDQVENQGVKV